MCFALYLLLIFFHLFLVLLAQLLHFVDALRFEGLELGFMGYQQALLLLFIGLLDCNYLGGVVLLELAYRILEVADLLGELQVGHRGSGLGIFMFVILYLEYLVILLD